MPPIGSTSFLLVNKGLWACNRKWKDWKNSGTSCFSLTLIHLVFVLHAESMPARTLSVEKRTFIALEYQKTDDVKATLDAFQLRWPEESRPSKNTPGRLLTKLKENHTLGYLYPKEIKKRVLVLLKYICLICSINLILFHPVYLL